MMLRLPTLRIALSLFALLLGSVTAAGATGLVALPVPAESFESGSLHVDRYGDGDKTLIFIPGLGSGPWSWAEQIGRFSKTSRVYALTLNGFDGRTYAPQADLFGSFARDFFGLLETRHIVRPVVIGHSLGGTVAIALAEAHPERLAGVIALDGLPVFPAVAQQAPAQRIAAAAAIAAQIAAQSSAELLAYDARFMQTTGTLDATLVQPAAELEARSDPRAVAAWTQADLEADLRPGLPKATVPLLELMPYAAGSPYTQDQTLAFYRALLDGAPRLSVTPVPDARHFAMLDQPVAVDAAIADFVATTTK